MPRRKIKVLLFKGKKVSNDMKKAISPHSYPCGIFKFKWKDQIYTLKEVIKKHPKTIFLFKDNKLTINKLIVYDAFKRFSLIEVPKIRKHKLVIQKTYEVLFTKGLIKWEDYEQKERNIICRMINPLSYNKGYPVIFEMVFYHDFKNVKLNWDIRASDNTHILTQVIAVGNHHVLKKIIKSNITKSIFNEPTAGKNPLIYCIEHKFNKCFDLIFDLVDCNEMTIGIRAGILKNKYILDKYVNDPTIMEKLIEVFIIENNFIMGEILIKKYKPKHSARFINFTLNTLYRTEFVKLMFKCWNLDQKGWELILKDCDWRIQYNKILMSNVPKNFKSNGKNVLFYLIKNFRVSAIRYIINEKIANETDNRGKRAIDYLPLVDDFRSIFATDIIKLVEPFLKKKTINRRTIKDFLTLLE